MTIKKHAFGLLTLTLILAIVGATPTTTAAQTSVEPAIVHNSWSSGAPMPTAVWCPMVGVLEGQIYVVGGVNAAGTTIAETQIYDPATNTWNIGKPLPKPTCGGVAAVVGNVLYVIGGCCYSKAVWAYDPSTEKWSAKAAMLTARTDMGAAVLNGIIYVIGGNTRTQSRSGVVESYNPTTNKWSKQDPLLVGKSEPSVGLVGTKIVATDGYAATGETGDNEDYNATTNAWTSLNSDPIPRNAACGGGIGAAMYVAGGYPGSGPALSSNESFSPSKNTWKSLAPMLQAALFAGSAVYKGQLYCIGGSEAFGTTVLNNVQIYQP